MARDIAKCATRRMSYSATFAASRLPYKRGFHSHLATPPLIQYRVVVVKRAEEKIEKDTTDIGRVE